MCSTFEPRNFNQNNGNLRRKAKISRSSEQARKIPPLLRLEGFLMFLRNFAKHFVHL